MPVLIAVAGFLGAWLLVAGPVYQAAVELRAEELDREEIEAVNAAVPSSPRMSAWWWLLPPVAFLRHRRQEQHRREAMLHVMATEQVERLLRFGAKATGWLIVALGAGLIAVKETWELAELLDWPFWAFVVLAVIALALALLWAPVRMAGDRRMMRLKARYDREADVAAS